MFRLFSFVKWTPDFGPRVKLWFSGSDQLQGDQYHEDQDEAEETQCSVQGQGGLGGCNRFAFSGLYPIGINVYHL